jgi:hypothetical protein
MIGEDPTPVAAFSTPQKLYNELEELVWQHDITWMDAVLLYAEQRNVDIEAVAAMISKNANLKEHIRTDAENLHFLPKTTRIPGLE